jgi:hypothetical protein
VCDRVVNEKDVREVAAGSEERTCDMTVRAGAWAWLGALPKIDVLERGMVARGVGLMQDRI